MNFAKTAGFASLLLALLAPAGFAALSYAPADPFSPVRILPDAEVAAGKTGLDAVAAGNSTAVLSAVVKSPADVKAFLAQCDGLKSDAGAIPAGAIDIRVVKCWYQAGNAWFCEWRDATGRTLVPELLLHDDALVATDDKTSANTIRAKGRYVPADSGTLPDADAPRLLPFPLKANCARQLVVAIALPEGTAPGLYKGALEFVADGAAAGKLDIALRVMPFSLRAPRRRYEKGDYLFLSGDTAAAKPADAFLTRLDPAAFAEDSYVVDADREDIRKAASRHYHVFPASATPRQLQARRAIGAASICDFPAVAAIENPWVWRVNKGIAPFLAGYAGVAVPAPAEKENPWGDDHGRLRSATFRYPLADGGYIPTLADFALRQAYGDVCLLSLVNELARKLLESEDHLKVVEGRRALAWLTDAQRDTSAPETTRLDAIAWADRLLKISEMEAR